jgi:hypothetical protein
MRVIARLKYKMFYFFAVSLMFFSLSCSFLVPDSCWATVRNSNSIYAYKRGLHIIQNNKNDACFCSFSTIWQLFWGFFIYLGYFQYQRTDSDTDLILIYLLNPTFSNISAITWRPVLVMEEARVPECTFFVNYKGRREPTPYWWW